MFETKLLAPRGTNRPPEDHYLAVNILGTVDHKRVGADKLIFRIEGARSFVIVRHKLKRAFEAAAIAQLTWDEVKILPTVANVDGTFSNLPLIKLP